MTIRDITDYLEKVAPLRFQESYDNAGLIYGDPDREVTSVLVSLDCTEDIVAEAAARGANLIVSHHPIVFRGIKQFKQSSYVHRTVVKAIQHDIAIYAIHTNLDNVLANGVNEKIAQKLSLTNLATLRKSDFDKKENDYSVGAGIIGEWDARSATEALQHIKDCMNVPVIKHTELLDREVAKVAICGGAGSFLLSDAIAAGADMYVTADYKYHEFFDADGRIMIADIGHYESEYYTIELLLELLTQKFPNFAGYSTEVVTNPVRYF